MNKYLLGVFLAGFFAVVVSFMFFSYQVSEPVIHSVVNEKRVPTLVVGDYNPGDNSGYFYFMIYPHNTSNTPYVTYNQSNATAYEFTDSWNTSCTGETPFSTAFDIVIKCGVTNEDGYWTGNQTRNPGYNWCHITCADLGIAANTNMTEAFINNGTNYAYYHYFVNNSGSGYQIAEGQSFNVTSVKFYVQRIT